MTCTWNGPAHKGAMRAHRKKKRLEAEARNEAYQAKSQRQLLRRIYGEPEETG